MKKIITIQIRSTEGNDRSFALKCFGQELKERVEAAGGKCLPVWANSFLTVAIEGMSPTAVDELVVPWLESLRPQSFSLSVVQNDAAPAPQGGIPTNFCRPGAIIRERLTRKFFFNLPTGSYVISNICSNGRSIFAEQMGDTWTRVSSWNRARASAATQRLCMVVWTNEEFEDAAAGRLL